MTNLKDIQKAIDFISKHDSENKQASSLQDLAHVFSEGTGPIEEALEIAQVEKPSWKRKLYSQRIAFPLILISGTKVIWDYSLKGDNFWIGLSMVIFMYVSLIALISGIIKAEVKLNQIKNLETFKEPIRGTYQCIELFKLKSESDLISNYIDTVTSQRELLTFDSIFCKTLASAEQKKAYRESDSEKIQLACAQLHGA